VEPREMAADIYITEKDNQACDIGEREEDTTYVIEPQQAPRECREEAKRLELPQAAFAYMLHGCELVGFVSLGC
jgi:hypothetical protein